MSFSGVDDIGLQASCELVQDVVVALLEHVHAPDAAHLSISKRELARRAGVGQATLWPLLNGELFPRIDTLVRVAQAAGISIGVL